MALLIHLDGIDHARAMRSLMMGWAVAFTVGAATIAGHRAGLLLPDRLTRRLPRDAGAWTGLALGALIAWWRWPFGL